jgi:outer membrane biosynthesis protein TonB
MNTHIISILLALFLVQPQPLRLLYAPPPVVPVTSPWASIVALTLNLNSVGGVENVSTIVGTSPFLDVTLEAVKNWKFAIPSAKDSQNSVNVMFLYRPRQIYSTKTDVYVPQPPPLSNRAAAARLIQDPTYPMQTVAEGVVILEVRVAETGQINEIHTVRGVPALTDIARQTVATWRFTPATVDGKPVEGLTVVAISFLRPIT